MNEQPADDEAVDASRTVTDANSEERPAAASIRSLAGLELPNWVGPQLESALRSCERGFDASWVLGDRLDDLTMALRNAERRIDDVAALSRQQLSRYELECLVADTIDTLRELHDVMPEPHVISQWVEDLDQSRSDVRRYLVQRQNFKLKLSDAMQVIKI